MVVRHDKLIVWLDNELAPFGRDLSRAAQSVLASAREHAEKT